MDTTKIETFLELTPEQHEVRRKGIGGSDTNIIMSGDEDKIYELWELKTKRREPESLAAILPVAMGCWTEELNVYWLQKYGVHREIVGVQKAVTDEKYPWLRSTLDGEVKLESGWAVVECKHSNAYSNRDKINDRYMPQFQHNMRVTGHSYAVVSVFFGNMEHDWWIVEENLGYQAEMLDRLCWFWDCVQQDREPFRRHQKVAPPPQRERHKKYDMSTNNRFVNDALDWIENANAKKKFDAAQKSLKDYILADEEAAEMYTDAITVKVAKNGSVRITERKS